MLDTFPTSVRTELLRINQEIEAATAERDEIQRRHDLISIPATELQNTVANLTLAKAEYDAEIVAWYEAACPGERPQPTGTLLSLEKTVGVLKSDIGASDGALASTTEALCNANATFLYGKIIRLDGPQRLAGRPDPAMMRPTHSSA